ncbi:MAG: efflux RND transporter permease subunit, partial [Methylovulum sp.]
MSDPLKQDSFTVSIVRLFTTSQLSLLFLIISLLAGAAALTLTPREEDPQIIVPVMDIFVEYPGASSEEVEKLVTTPMEVLLRQIDGVEYVYSASKPGMAMITVRYFVGQDREKSVIKTRDKLQANQDIIPPGVTSWIIKPVEIDDVPIVTLTLSSQQSLYDEMALRRIADELIERLRTTTDIGKSWVVGEAKRQITVAPDPVKMVAHNTSLQDIQQALNKANINAQVGAFVRDGREILLEAGPFFKTAEEVAATVIKTMNGRLAYLRDVARIEDGPEDTSHYTRIGFGPAVANMQRLGETVGALPQAGEERQMVTIAIAKRKGSNAVSVAEAVLKSAESLRGTLVPDDVLMTVTRNYGETADHKVNELVKHLGIAVVIIIVLLALTLGFKESLIVSLAVPMTFAVTLLFDLIFGYTINRVTLFALILSLGLLVDDPIVDVENIHRHYKLRKEPPLQALLTAVDEVRPPTILATFAVILSFVPMFYITGMMGPYMAPMAFNVPIAMLLSLIIAFTVTPWASYRLLKGDYGKSHGAPFELKNSFSYRIYDAALRPLIATPSRAHLFLGLVLLAFIGSTMIAVTRAAPLKLLPFDNKNELQLIIDMPEGMTLEQTDEVAQALGRYLATVNEVTDYQAYIGLASPMDFNGMVRHYYLRQGSNVGDVRINLVAKDQREHQSHDIALRIRPDIERLGKQYDANIKIVELPPGPPVLSTLVAEVYGPPEASYNDIIQASNKVKTAFAQTKGVVDVDDMVDAEHVTMHFRLNREKAALKGITAEQVAQTLQLAVQGNVIGAVHIDTERKPLEIFLQLPRASRSSAPDLLTLRIKNNTGALIALSEIGDMTSASGDPTIYHKNLQRLSYVTAEMAGRSPVEAVLDLFTYFDEQPLPEGYSMEMAGEGEWKITVDV